MDLFITNTQLFTSQDINWWISVVWITCVISWWFYQFFGLSFWRHPFTTKDLLMSKWFNATFLHICSSEKANSFSANCNFWVKYSFNSNNAKNEAGANSHIQFNSTELIPYSHTPWHSHNTCPKTIVLVSTFSRHFYPKWLTVHSGCVWFYQFVCSPGNWTHNLLRC